jgi:E3 ubiquitin-protein ligase SHPRH
VHSLDERINITISKIAKLEGKTRYLSNLLNDPNNHEGEQECLICKIEFTKGVVTPCGHFYCEDCSQKWMSVHRHCPICKTPVTIAELRSMSNSIAVLNTQQKNQVVSQLVAELKTIKICGSFGTKIDMIIKHLISLKRKQYDIKCLIFSQWHEVLKIVSDALRENNIGYLTLEGHGHANGKVIVNLRL